MDNELRTQLPQLQSMEAALHDETREVHLSTGGREITLYRVEPGESCILTTSCIMSDCRFPAFAVAETDVDARLVSAATVRQWMEAHPPRRRYVFDLLSGRLDAVIATLEEVAPSASSTRGLRRCW